jgi:hypothetical protein
MIPIRYGAAIAGVVAAVVTVLSTPFMVENIEANELAVIQSVSGELKCYTDPGPAWQGLGTVTKYPRRGTYAFDEHKVDAAGKDITNTGKPLQFNDGGTAWLYGSVNWEMPLDCKQVIAIHKTFGSRQGVESQGVARMVNLAIQLSGSTMTSLESFAERKGELIEIVNDQAQQGAYQMVTKQVERTNPITNQLEKVLAAEVVRDKTTGKPVRQQASILDQYGIHLQPMSIEKLDYSKIVQDQITERQKATTQVQISQANAQKAIQAAITAEREGQATAAKAKWEQETIKAKEVTKAEQGLAVATLAAKEAEQYKREQILRGEGDAERKKLVMADGALDQKLKAYVDVQGAWASAFAQFKGQLVPQVTTGGSANGVSSAQNMLDLIGIKAAKDLAVDLSASKK